MKTRALLSHRGTVAEITFTPDVAGKPPTIDYEVLDELEGHLKTLAKSAAEGAGASGGTGISLLVLKSASPKYFVVGANLEVLKSVDKDSIIPWVERGHEVFNRLEELPLPTIARIEGFALGGGLELAMACDFIYGSTKAKFGLPEAGLGFIPGWGGSIRLPERVGWTRAKEMFFTGRIIDSDEALRMGLINFLGTSEEIDGRLAETTEAVERNSLLSIRMIKKIVTVSMTENRRRAVMEEAVASGVCLASGDTTRRLREFFEKREKR